METPATYNGEPVREFGLPRHQEPKYTVTPEGRIVNRYSGKPVDDPLLFLRAQDKLSLPTLQFYRQQLAAAGISTASLDERILAFSAFAEAHPERMKLPGQSVPSTAGA